MGNISPVQVKMCKQLNKLMNIGWGFRPTLSGVLFGSPVGSLMSRVPVIGCGDRRTVQSAGRGKTKTGWAAGAMCLFVLLRSISSLTGPERTRA